MKKELTIDVRVKKIIADQLILDEEEITPQSKIIEDLGGDSLDVVEIVMLVEEEFDIEIPEDMADEIVTVKNVVDCITVSIK